MTVRRAWMFDFAGWLLFTASALFFVWSSARAGDAIGLIASIFFLLACIAFMVPAWAKRPR
jgi:hypothetical protein